MALKGLKAVQGGSRELQALQSAIREALGPVLASSIVDGELIEEVNLVTGVDNLVNHGLKRTPRIWIVVKKNAESDVWELSSPAPGRVLNLRSSTNVTVNLWVA